mmetsp:Transcript_17862/g.30325  ORF Transcript_17862/g.30325 Transcript_17862/m.30325 type:complete len:125 (+) Transcript_17862:1959-2333(+)
MSDPLMRIIQVAVSLCSSYQLVKGRTAKPFNPMLGETYELVTPHFRVLAEQVSHHPPVAACNFQGQGWECIKTLQTIIKFSGKLVTVEDVYPSIFNLFPECLNGETERYIFSTPTMTIGNLVVG